MEVVHLFHLASVLQIVPNDVWQRFDEEKGRKTAAAAKDSNDIRSVPVGQREKKIEFRKGFYRERIDLITDLIHNPQLCGERN